MTEIILTSSILILLLAALRRVLGGRIRSEERRCRERVSINV